MELNDELKCRPREKSSKRVRARLDETKGRQCPSWIAVRMKAGRESRWKPTPRRRVDPVQEQLIVELLSRVREEFKSKLKRKKGDGRSSFIYLFNF